MISPEECHYYVNWHGWLTFSACSNSQHTPACPTPKHTHTRTLALTKVHVRIKPARPTPLLQTIPTVFVKYSMLNAEQISGLSYQRKAGNSAVNTDDWEIKLFPFSSFMDFLRFPEFTIEPQWTVVVTETLYFLLNWFYSSTPLCAALYIQAGV